MLLFVVALFSFFLWVAPPPLRLRRGELVECNQVSKCLSSGRAAHFPGRLEAGTNRWPIWLTEYQTTVTQIKLHTTYAGRFSVWHAGYR